MYMRSTGTEEARTKLEVFKAASSLKKFTLKEISVRTGLEEGGAGETVSELASEGLLKVEDGTYRLSEDPVVQLLTEAVKENSVRKLAEAVFDITQEREKLDSRERVLNVIGEAYKTMGAKRIRLFEMLTELLFLFQGS